MTWVMPPASVATTLLARILSSSDVLPWSTWPMIVTIGARGTRSSGLSGWLNAAEQLLFGVGRLLDLQLEAVFQGQRLRPATARRWS